MKIFLDSAITTDIQDRLATEIIDGVTTNPTLIKKSNEDPDVVYKELYDMRVKDISIEVRGETAEELTANGICTVGSLAQQLLLNFLVLLKVLKRVRSYPYWVIRLI